MVSLSLRSSGSASDASSSADSTSLRSNGYRTKLWKRELRRFVDESGLAVTVAHYPPGTSKWNKIEHRMFCHITQNWRGRPLESVGSIVSLIGSTTTKAGLRIRSALDKNHYEKAIRVSDEEMADIHIKPHRFHGDWNYTIRQSPS